MSKVGNGEIDDRLHSVLTNGSLSRSPAEIAASRAENPLLDSPTEPSCVLRPADGDELQQLMQLANELRGQQRFVVIVQCCLSGFYAEMH